MTETRGQRQKKEMMYAPRYSKREIETDRKAK